MIDRGSIKPNTLKVCAFDIWTTDHRLIGEDISREHTVESQSKRKICRGRVRRLEDEKHKVFQKEMIENVKRFEAVLINIEKEKGNEHVAGQRFRKAWENVVDVETEEVIGKKMIRYGTSVKWWDDGLRKARKERRDSKEIHQ